jgi:hypothetical protein
MSSGIVVRALSATTVAGPAKTCLSLSRTTCHKAVIHIREKLGVKLNECSSDMGVASIENEIFGPPKRRKMAEINRLRLVDQS